MLEFFIVFTLGLALRLLCILTITPDIVTGLYGPFLEFSLINFSIDPWTTWIASNGASSAFPYGVVMYFFLAPGVFIATELGLSSATGYVIILLVADFLFFFFLTYLIKGRLRLISWVYWLSPIVIIPSYVLGYNDIIVALLMLITFLFLQRKKGFLAAIFCLAAVSAKLSMAVAVPFIAIYLLNDRRLRDQFWQFAFGGVIGSFLFLLPTLMSASAIDMIFGNPEMGLISAKILVGTDKIGTLIFPFLYMVALFLAWKQRPINFDIFQYMVGMSFLILSLFATQSAGWMIWSIQALVVFQAFGGLHAVGLVSAFSSIFAISQLSRFCESVSNVCGNQIHSLAWLNSDHGVLVSSLTKTGTVAIGVIIILQVWQRLVERNRFFRTSRRPTVINIAGDSGSGKDTLARSLVDLLGQSNVASISGDNYHLWDRNDKMWQVYTHLNPAANDLEKMSRDVIALVDRQRIYTQYYDHASGRKSFQGTMKSGEFIVVSGLHALFSPVIVAASDLKIFLEMDEPLRHWLKIHRDTSERGHERHEILKSLRKREPDRRMFIEPQRHKADLIIKLFSKEEIDENFSLSQFKPLIRFEFDGLFNQENLVRNLTTVVGQKVSVETIDGTDKTLVTVEGDARSSDIETVANAICREALNMLGINPNWNSGSLGICQLVVLCILEQALYKRLVS